jgi:protein-disulfide isomerase
MPVLRPDGEHPEGSAAPGERKIPARIPAFPASDAPLGAAGLGAAACAQEQGMDFFWRLHDFLFDHQRELTPENLRTRIDEYARGLEKFDGAKFSQCMTEKRTAAKIDGDVKFALENGINATPTLFINGQRTRLSGPEHLRTLIRELSKPAATPTPVAAR